MAAAQDRFEAALDRNVVGQSGVSPDEAFGMLRERSQGNNVTLMDLAWQIVEGHRLRVGCRAATCVPPRE